MEFGQLMADILVYVSCKFELYIFEIAQVIGENVPIVFLYVLSICSSGAGTDNPLGSKLKKKHKSLSSLNLVIFHFKLLC